MRRAVLTVGLATSFYVSIASFPALAEPALGEGNSELDRLWKSCPRRASADNGNLGDMIECAARASALGDSELNRTYRSRLSSLSPARQKVLRSSQRAWLKTRDNKVEKCASAERGPDGAEYRLFLELCRAGEVLDRVNVVRRWK